MCSLNEVVDGNVDHTCLLSFPCTLPAHEPETQQARKAEGQQSLSERKRERAKAIGREAPADLEDGKQAKRIATWYHASCDTGKRMAHALPDYQLSGTDDEEPAMPHYPPMY